jgi:hypothetical protein
MMPSAAGTMSRPIQRGFLPVINTAVTKLRTRQEYDMNRFFLFAFLVLMLASPVNAKEDKERSVVADTPEKFELLMLAVRQEMAPGKRYEFLSTRNRNTVNHNLDLMNQMLINAGSVAEMNEARKVELFTMQEEVNGILARNAADRLVCTYVAPVGSHIPKKRCHTVRELAESKADFKRKAREMQTEQLAVDASTNNFLN